MLDHKKDDFSPEHYEKPSISWNPRLVQPPKNSSIDLPAKSLAQKYNAQSIGPRSLPTFKSVVPTHYYTQGRYNVNFLQWPKSDMPKGITSVTERRLLARAEALNQRTQTGLSAAQSLPKITESIALQLQQNQMKKAPWARATASEPQQRLGAANINYRLAARAPVHFGAQGPKVVQGSGPSRSSTASDFAWYRNSRVSDIWK
uniref:Uncharacterized protein n=1 Tax=Bracon brevicornis TaxID=1563983 RepID=A0A6V7JHX8_9HYME